MPASDSGGYSRETETWREQAHMSAQGTVAAAMRPSSARGHATSTSGTKANGTATVLGGGAYAPPRTGG